MGVYSLGRKRPDWEATHSLTSSAEVKNAWIVTTSPPIYMYTFVFRHRDNFTFTIKVKVKVKLPLCLTKHHAMKEYWGSEGIAPLIL
jgi:hypothetical protein